MVQVPKIEQQKSSSTPASKPPAPTPPAKRPQYSTDDPFSILRPVAEAQDNRVSLVLYGRNRIGKTTLACKFPKPLLLMSMEPTLTGGAKSVAKEPGVEWAVVKSSEMIARFAERLHKPNHFKTVVLDSVSSWEKIVLQEIRGDATPLEMLRFGKVSQDDYTLRSEKMRDSIAPFLGLMHHNVILIGNEKDHSKPQEGTRRSSVVTIMQENSFFWVEAGGGLASWLHDSWDFICKMFMDKEYKRVEVELNGVKDFTMEETGRLIRRIRLKYHPNYAAGPRAADDPEWRTRELPEFIDGDSPKELYQNFMAAIK